VFIKGLSLFQNVILNASVLALGD